MIISENIIEILTRYLLTVNNYNKFFFKNISIYKNSNFIKNLHIKGLLLLNNIFNISLLYIDSLVDIYNLCEKGYVYFIEFINQININNSYESNSFELTLKDAVIFSYKKTIFTIENNIQCDISEINKNKLKIINECLYIINNSCIIFNYDILNLYQTENYNENIIDSQLNLSTLNLTKFIKKILINTELNSKQYETNNNYIYYFKNINSLLNFINENYHLNNNNKDLFKNLITFLDKYIIKKIFLKKIDILNIDSNFFDLLNKNENIQFLLNSLCKTI